MALRAPARLEEPCLSRSSLSPAGVGGVGVRRGAFRRVRRVEGARLKGAYPFLSINSGRKGLIRTCIEGDKERRRSEVSEVSGF